MNWVPSIVCAVLGFLTVVALIPVIRRRHAGRVAAAAEHTFHHTHKTPISRLGGVALAVTFAVVALLVSVWFSADAAQARLNLVVVFSSLGMFLVGLWDDLRPLGARKKLLLQVFISTAVCSCGVLIEKFQIPVTIGFLNLHAGEVYELGIWGWFITIFWLVALTNMINLIDGVDGLAAGIALMVMGLLTAVRGGGELSLPILCGAGMFGALLGFLRYNFPPAKIYMGDGGAYFLGFLIAILTLVHSQKGTIVAALIAPVFALALPIVDVSLAIIRRGLKGLPIFRADRKHIH